MEARAASTAATRERIVEAAQARFMSDYYDDVTLRGVAAQAGVALGTVVNHFKSKDGLFTAVADRLRGQVEAELDEAPVGDTSAAVRTLMDRYEQAGDATMRALAVEDRVEALRPLLADGRAHMYAWVERTFEPALHGMTGERRKRRILTLVVACDVLTWKQLRRDRGLSQEQTTILVEELVEGIINQSSGRNQ
jgi:AcrR family transcriptional regulator